MSCSILKVGLDLVVYGLLMMINNGFLFKRLSPLESPQLGRQEISIIDNSRLSNSKYS